MHIYLPIVYMRKSFSKVNKSMKELIAFLAKDGKQTKIILKIEIKYQQHLKPKAGRKHFMRMLPWNGCQ